MRNHQKLRALKKTPTSMRHLFSKMQGKEKRCGNSSFWSNHVNCRKVLKGKDLNVDSDTTTGITGEERKRNLQKERGGGRGVFLKAVKPRKRFQKEGGAMVIKGK